ncbi:GNAT family N-acetyltransferase [Paracoccaceae bacterium GXU_MW_L88]
MTEAAVTITYLEMAAPPDAPPPLPDGFVITEAVNFPLWYFFSLYDAVGAAYQWTDRHDDRDGTAAWIARHDVRLFTLEKQGWPHGFFMLEGGETVDLAYFGLVPEAVGLKIGRTFLRHAVATAYKNGAKKLTVNTCTLDHPRALPLYQSVGFQPIRTKERMRNV